MEPVRAPASECRYRAFISYSHSDKAFANWLHRSLEGFRLPPSAAADGHARITPVFIDRAELAAGDLSQQVRDALAVSAALVVVASPAARASRWVAQEIALFRELNPDRPILTALISGEPAEAFPDPLVHHGGETVEPLAADFRSNGDGKRLALIKIVAGLSALPLDRLVQRDAQARQRRVMAVTAFALVLSLILATLLVMAMRERAEAQRQRADAEGMVEFMLTDLRDKLQGVGRIEIMDSVNRKAMDHYAADRNLDALPADMLQRRARLLTAMGEDETDAGDLATAKRNFDEAYRVTATLLAREPDNPERIFNHAQSEYWVGAIPFKARDRAAVQPHWNAYLDLAKRLVAKDSANITWQRELAYAESNLCALALVAPQQPEIARKHCSGAVDVAARIAAAEPTNLVPQLDYLNDLGWRADAERYAGNWREALRLRQQQRGIVATLPVRFPNDVRPLQATMQVLLGLAQTQQGSGDREAARATAREALSVADRLQARDPQNRTWANWRVQLADIAKAD